MPLDPLLVPVLEAYNAAPRPVLQRPEDAYALRAAIAAAKATGDPMDRYKDAAPDVSVEADAIAVNAPPAEIPLQIYRDAGATHGSDARPRGALVVYHGGGWCLGSIEDSDRRCRTYASQTGVLVVNVGYRLAPEHPFPTPLEDCYQALVWTAEHAHQLGIDPDRIGVAGDSAGANLAAAVCLLARDRGGPPVCFQLLEIPGLDLTLSSPSVERYPTGYMLEAEDIRWCVRTYLAGHDASDPLASPLLAEDLRGLPPAYIACAECDPLADDGRRYAERLAAHGVAVKHREYEGQIHASHALTALLPTARAWRDDVVAAVREHLKESPASFARSGAMG